MRTPYSPVILSAALLAGCVSVGRPFRTTSEAPTLIVGKTTQTEVLKRFGPPTREGTEDDDETWTYLDYKVSLFGGGHAEDLFVRFNKDGSVKAYNFNTDYSHPK